MDHMAPRSTIAATRRSFIDDEERILMIEWLGSQVGLSAWRNPATFVEPAVDARDERGHDESKFVAR